MPQERIIVIIVEWFEILFHEIRDLYVPTFLLLINVLWTIEKDLAPVPLSNLRANSAKAQNPTIIFVYDSTTLEIITVKS